MRITFLCQYFPPEMGAPAARTYEHARHWAALGHEVTVVTGFPNHPTGVIRPEYRGMWLKRERIEGIDLLRTWVYCAPNKGFLRRILNFLSFFFSSLILGGLCTGRPDVVIGTSPQFFCAVAAWLLSRWKRVPFVFEVRDIWPQSAIELGALRNRLVIGILEKIEQHLYRAATLIVVVAESTRPYLLDRGIPDNKIVVIPNGIDPGFLEFRGQGPAEIRDAHGWRESFLVSYIGTHGLSHALEVVLAAAGQLEDCPEIHFLFVGEGAEKSRLLALAAGASLRNVTFLNEQPRETLPALYRASDIGLVTLRRLPIFTRVLPSKLFELMGTGCPIICSVEGEAAQLVERSGAGVCIEPENPDALREAIVRLRANRAERLAMGRSGEAFVRTNYARNVLAKRYLEALCEHISSSSSSRH
ncbi:MAG: hypothetical protein RIR52_1591 [Acidobacteriota bacterium]